MMQYVWLAFVILFVVAECMTVGLVSIWFAGGALVTFFVAMATETLWIQLLVFFAVSFVLLFVTRPIASKFYNSRRTKTNVDSLVGEYCKVTEAIDNFNGTGTVVLNGMDWTARSVDDTIIEVDSKVKVCGIDGVKVLVGKVEHNN